MFARPRKNVNKDYVERSYQENWFVNKIDMFGLFIDRWRPTRLRHTARFECWFASLSLHQDGVGSRNWWKADTQQVTLAVQQQEQRLKWQCNRANRTPYIYMLTAMFILHSYAPWRSELRSSWGALLLFFPGDLPFRGSCPSPGTHAPPLELGEHCKLPRWVRAKPGRQMTSGANCGDF